jgi:hypothetical protein
MRVSLSIILVLSLLSVACVAETESPEPLEDAGPGLVSHPTEAGQVASYCEAHPDVPACVDSGPETD